MNAEQQFADKIAKVGGWKGERLQQIWDLVSTNCKGLTLEWKWNTACWTLNKKPLLATSSFKDFVKINFFDGALLDDTTNLFNSGLESKSHRSINFYEQDTIPHKEIVALIKQAIKLY